MIYYHEELAKNLLKLINHKGIINIGGPKMVIYDLQKKLIKTLYL